MGKIMFVIGQMSNGGAERVVSILANEFIKEFEVCVVCPIKDELVYTLNDKVTYYGNKDNLDTGIKRKIKNYRFISNCINAESPDILIAFTTEINIYCCFYKILHRHMPLIISERNDPARDPSSKWKRRLRSLLYPVADSFVFQTQYVKDYFCQIIKKKGRVIYNPILDSLPDYTFEDTEDKVVSVSRLQKQKNIPLLIDAFKLFLVNHKDYKLEIYGNGSEKSYIQKYIDKNNLQNSVKLMGFQNDIHSKIINAKMFVLSSDYEGMSNAMLEALRMGLPTICTDCPAYSAREVIQNGVNGFLVKPNNCVELSSKMDMIASDNELAKKISENAKAIKEKITLSSIIGQWKELINETWNI